MAKELDFQDHSAQWEDADGDKHTHTVSAAVVDKETAGEYVTVDGAKTVKPGDVLVRLDRPDVYDVHSAKAWAESDYGKGSKPAAKPAAKRAASKRAAPKSAASNADSVETK